MRKCFTVVCSITFFAGTLSVWAGDFWEEKRFADWSEKEVTKMLSKSPWARRVTIAIGSLLGSHGRAGGSSSSESADGQSTEWKPLSQVILQSGGPGSSERLGAPAGGRDSGGDGPAVSRPSGRFRPRITLTIRWYSALPIKQAVVKARFGSQIDPSKQAAELLKRGQTHYVVGISGVPFPMIVRHSELADSDSQELPPIRERLKEIFERTRFESFLKIKNREPIAAEAVRVQQDLAQNAVDAEALRSAADIYLVFPRLGDAEELITLADKKVEFVTQIGPLKVERKFKLKDMVYNGKLEL